MEKEADQEQETDMAMVNTYVMKFYFNHSVIIANPKTSSNKVLTMVPFKVDTGV